LKPLPFRSIAITPPELNTLPRFQDWFHHAKQKGAEAILLRHIPSVLINPIIHRYAKELPILLHATYQRDWEILHFNQATMDAYGRLSGRIYGYSAHSLAELVRYQSQFDYFFFSPIFSTSSHPDHPPLGIESLSQAVKMCSKPIFALGGIVNDAYVECCKKAGAFGFASISYFLKD
jgi:hypothetical protein